MKHPKLIVYSDDRTIDYTIDWQYINHGIIKNISQLNKGINASSSTAEVTLSHDSPYTLPILEYEKDLHAILYETVSGTNVPHFTGYVSHDFTWTVNSHGTKAVRITLEDVGTRVLKKAYTEQYSEVISGTATACFQTICSRAGVTPTSSINNIITEVSTVVKEGETCQELLNSLCKELGYSYYFTVDGQFEIKALSTDNLSGVPTVNDTDLYDSIKLNKQARQYRGASIEYTTLETRNNTLVYRDITNQSPSHKDCWVELNLDDYYPDGTTSSHGTFIDAVDLKEGKKVYSITNLTPTINWNAGGGTSLITLHGVQALEVRIQCTSVGTLGKGIIDKLEATADLTYEAETHKFKTTVDQGSEDRFEYTSRWIHSETDAKKMGNFMAQYYEYCSREFTFKSKAHFTLGQIIKLHENIFSGLETYLIISTIKETDSTQIITYTANSISAFNYTKQGTAISTSAPPSTVYVQIPDAEFENVTTEITANPDIFYTDLRDVNTSTGVPNTSRIDLKYYYNASTTTPDTVIWDVRDNYNNPITLIYDNASHSEAHIDLARTTTATSIIAKAYVTGLQSVTSQEKTINIIDATVYNKNWGTITSLPSNYRVQNGDYFLAGSGLSGYTYGVPYVRVSGSWTQLTGNSVDNVQRLMGVLGSALNSDLTVPATSALYAWFGTLIAQDAVITNLFSKDITILNNGSIHSAAYDDTGTYIGPGPGFWLGANGQLFCNSGQMENLAISGNSVFGGDFDCDVIKTADGSVSVRGTAQATDISKYQSRQLARDIRSLSLGGGLQPARIRNASGTYQQAVAYVSFFIDEGSQNTEYKVSFFDSAGSSINVTNMFSCTTNRESGPSIHYRKGRGISPPEYYTYSNVSFTIEFIQGANRTLQLTLPGGSSGLAPGMIYKDSSGFVRIVL